MWTCPAYSTCASGSTTAKAWSTWSSLVLSLSSSSPSPASSWDSWLTRFQGEHFRLVGLSREEWAIPGLFLLYFRLFHTKINTPTTNTCEKCPTSIRCWDSKPNPCEHEWPPITTRPGHPPIEHSFTS